MPISSGNALLRALPQEEFQRLQPYLKSVPLTAGQRLSGVDEAVTHVWFPEDGAVSRLVHLVTGETVEAGIVGSEGVIGLPLALGATNGLGICRVHIAGSAQVMAASDFEEHVYRHGGPLFDGMLRYANVYIGVLGQLTACHCLHRIEQRLSRCILTLGDYGADSCVRITHDTLAEFLGVHRPSITYALQALAATGALALERRRILIANREALFQHACDCYAAIRSMTAREPEQTRAAT